ncbi:Alpha/Beta hydrolase protein [Apiosordaria backusii]|uniref:Alpha/Beta hydrolase protein n=1 Tax=Apiosordaria backusii TaxID=314023 RepID=A0AA40EC34_9PEZI|nr:Alpha/Beta hydrolase protein [Apiosordaria backusii]
MVRILGAAVALAGLAASESLKKLNTGLTILTNNDLQGADSPFADSAVLITESHVSNSGFEKICSGLGEQPWSESKKKGGKTVLQPLFDYLRYEKRASSSSRYWIAGRKTIDVDGDVDSTKSRDEFAGLCTNKAPFSNETFQDTSSKWQVSVDVNNQTLTGFRDRLSFRFLGVRYAPQPQKFTYSTLFQGSGEAASALEYGSQCAQGSNTGTEDCLFLNVWTPYLPNPNSAPSKKQLRPVAFWLHGGAFTGGTANDPTFDGGNMASRGDIVVVAINYRLSTLGFLALKDGKTNGNFGLADQITALDWVRKNIQSLGGDPDRVTIFGQSAGAGSVRALTASPKAINKFSGAILLSNLGGLNYGTTYSEYYTIDEQVSVVANTILNATNCTNAPSQVDCLRALPPHALTSLTSARYLVVDGTYLTSPELSLTPTSKKRPLNILMGITHDDGAPFISFPSPTTTNSTQYLLPQGYSPSMLPATPGPNSGNFTLDLFNTTTRLATNAVFRCIDQATAHAALQNNVFSSVYYYEFDRTYQMPGWPKLDVCEPPRTKTHPHGDPSKPYLKCHSGELYYVFGTIARQGLPNRDEGDLPFEQYILDSFVGFIKSGNPNLDRGYLRARGGNWKDTLRQVERAGEWEAVKKGQRGLRLRGLDWPTSKDGPFRELEYCEGLGLGLDYYL